VIERSVAGIYSSKISGALFMKARLLMAVAILCVITTAVYGRTGFAGKWVTDPPAQAAAGDGGGGGGGRGGAPVPVILHHAK
jgi:hypothetical protein